MSLLSLPRCTAPLRLCVLPIPSAPVPCGRVGPPTTAPEALLSSVRELHELAIKARSRQGEAPQERALAWDVEGPVELNRITSSLGEHPAQGASRGRGGTTSTNLAWRFQIMYLPFGSSRPLLYGSGTV